MSRLKKRQINEKIDDNRNNKRQQLGNEQISSATNLETCRICNRRFNQSRLIEHEQACKGSKKFHSNSSQRYHYNSQMHRWKGLDYGTNTSRSNAKRTKLQASTKQFPKTHWREKHQQFQAAVKGQYNPANDLIESLNDRPYQCSQCQRKFATENAITKHQKGCTGQRRMGVKSRDLRNKSFK